MKRDQGERHKFTNSARAGRPVRGDQVPTTRVCLRAGTDHGGEGPGDAVGSLQRSRSRPPWTVVNIIRIEDGLLKEHWDVIEDEVTRANSLSGLPMFGDTFPEER